MVVSDFEILLIYVTFYLSYVKKLSFNVLIKKKKTSGPAVKGLIG